MKKYRFLLAIILVAALAGCATTDMQLAKANFNPAALVVPAENAGDYRDRKATELLRDLLIEPWDATSVKETPSLLRGDVSCFHVPFPDELRKEQPVPERIKWYALIVAGGYEYLGQLLKRTPNGNTSELIVDGGAEALKGAKVIALSTRAKKVFGLFSPDAPGVEIEMEKFINDPGYRRSMAEKHGALLSNFERTDELISVINAWNRFDTPRGYILTPLDEKRFREILDINPGYSHSQKLVRDGKWSISTDPIGMLINNVIMNNAKAAMAPTSGWDFHSKPAKP